MKNYLLFFISLFCFETSFAINNYELAVQKAALHEPGISAKPLIALENSYVRMLTFTTYSGYKTSDNILGASIWTTVEPEVKSLCKKYVLKNKNHLRSHQLNLWIARLLGLPENNAEQRRFVVLVVPVIQAYYGEMPSRIGIFRPCTDPRIYAHSDNSPICPNEMNAKDKYISSDYKTWFINNSIHAYSATNGAPWTEYGYTYNWNADAESVYGVSEFVVLKNTPVTVLANPHDNSTPYISAAQYCESEEVSTGMTL